jgi:hypothetical protein
MLAGPGIISRYRWNSQVTSRDFSIVTIFRHCKTSNSVVELRQDHGAIRGDCHRMLEVHTRAIIFGCDGPVVDLGYSDMFGSGIDHRFNGDHKSWFEPKIMPAQLRADEVWHLRVFVHFPADAVANELFNDAESALVDLMFHYCGHLRPSLAASQVLNRQPKVAFANPEQSLLFIVDLADRVGPSGIAAPTLQPACRINADDVALTKFPVAGYSMHDLFIN